MPLDTMSTTTMQYSEAQLPHKQSEKFAASEHDFSDAESLTLTVQTGVSSGFRNNMGSRISRHSIKIKTSSSFPNLLNLYQEPIREESNLHAEKVRKKKEKKPKERKLGAKLPKLNFEDATEKRAKQENRKIRTHAVAREQMEKFDNYCRAMKTKVERQRAERLRYNEELQERLRAQEEMERQKLRLHRGPKHIYVHDKSYLKSLPQSNFCKTTLLADDLQKKGVLKGHSDVEKFWSNYGSRRSRGVDIFAADSQVSVNYPNKWMGMKKPEIHVESDDDLEDANTLQLPPLKKSRHKVPRQA